VEPVDEKNNIIFFKKVMLLF